MPYLTHLSSGFTWRALVLLSVMLLSNMVSAASCREERNPPFDFELVTIHEEITRNSDGSVNSYRYRFGVDFTLTSQGTITDYDWVIGGRGSFSDESELQFTFFNQNLARIIVRIDDSEGQFLSKTFVFKPGEGVVPGVTADFVATVRGDVLTVQNTTANPKDVRIDYRWSFGDGQVAFEESPDDISFSGNPPGEYCVYLSAQERSGDFGEITEFDQFDFVSKTITVLTDEPIAAFDADVLGKYVRFDNQSTHPFDQPMTYLWDFGDGEFSTETHPRYTYDLPGFYTVTLTATDPDGDSDTVSREVTTRGGLFVRINGPETLNNGDQEQFSVDVYNFEAGAVVDFSLRFPTDNEFFVVNGIPKPAVLRTIPRNSGFTSYFKLDTLKAGEAVLQAIGSGGVVNVGPVQASDTHDVLIQPELTLTLNTPTVVATDEEITLTADISNNEAVAITGIRVEPLGIIPNELLETISGPTTPSGSDPRAAPFDLGAGQSTTITWQYLTEGRGVVELQASASYNLLAGSGSAVASDQGSVAIDIAAIELSDVRLQPGRPIPGSFNVIRGTITNIGNFDVTNIDFELANTTPHFDPMEVLIAKLPPDISPRIEIMEPGEVRQFIIPVAMELEIGSASSYTLPLTFSGAANVDGESVSVGDSETLRSSIDRSEYWVDILDEFFSLLVNGFVSLVDEVDQVADRSTLGGIAVGTGQGVLNVLQRMGDAELAVVDFLGETSGDGGQRLTEQGQQLVNIITEYNNTTSFEQKLADLSELGENVSVAGVDIFANWMFDIEQAANEGRTRDVATLLAEPVAEVATGFGVEQAGARLFTRFLDTGVGRQLLKRLRKKGDIPDEDASAQMVQRYLDQLDEKWDDVPEGVPLTGQAALAAGVEGDDLAFMIDTAKRNNVTFFVRPRPPSAAKWARAGFNAKPLSIKLKSVSELDHQWLGYNQADEGLIVIREPSDPTDKLRSAIETGELDIDEDRAQINAILKRYSAKKAEFENNQAFINKVNSVKKHRVVREPDPANPDLDLVEEVEQAGIVVKRYGRDVITTVSIDPSTNRLVFDYNGRPVYSDIDLLSVARQDGTNVAPSLHEKVLREASYGADGQHHATAQTSDFPNARVAQSTAAEFLFEHTKAGEGGAVLIIGPDTTTKGYVDSFDLISADEALALDSGRIKLSDYDLYGLVVKSVKYTGAQSR